MSDNGIEVTGLVKKFGAVTALEGLDLTVPAGTVLGLLGPNGAGKTTAVRIITTLLRPDAGRALVAGLDVVSKADEVRKVIGLSGQYAACDPILTGRENLVMFGRLHHIGTREARRRADEMIERFDLTELADRPARTYSGGNARRLDLAATLLVRPKVIFLDEPTAGLDPRSRRVMWEVIEGLVRDGATLLLTTQYLEEADALAARIVIVERGTVVAEGTPDELRGRIGGERVELVLEKPADLPAAVTAMTGVGSGEVTTDEEALRIVVPVAGGAGSLTTVVRELDSAGVQAHDLALRRPTLDDVFLALTGRKAEAIPAPRRGGRPGGRGRR
ncbi:ATP-binding cassette domain-containing protein [Asanoa sp. WMMD1127]|uniref:ATP-binding cassette domain-containing protein n=1 Tax=Asanoa sp. WMMD1127 TaxID=3016107 RepID=UPI0024169FDA|nr:ATP-binding cassette domain-containing protein [Asanoa sp. WMMD1127]MDG4820792.1 ATP-binding cassette domain-containing protein [Asanoa sp. WMMD1127]